MTPQQILDLKQKIRELDSAATKGPWKDCTASDGLCQCKSIWSIPHDCEVASATKKWGDGVEGRKDWMEYGEIPEAEFQANKDFIALAREALPTLLAYCEELEGKVEKCVEFIKDSGCTDEYCPNNVVDGCRPNRIPCDCCVLLATLNPSNP